MTTTVLGDPAIGSRLSTRRVVGAVVVATVALRLVLVLAPPHPDEAGYLMVARAWHLGGPTLYGHYWVDRPPGLIGLYKIASLVPWIPMIRVLTIPFVVLFIVSAAWAAHQVAGERAARWSAVVAGALAVSPLLGTQVADGELFAAPLVMFAVALTLKAVRRPGGPSYRLAFVAGLVAGLAVSVKQNFGDALLFAIVLVVASVVQGRLGRREAAYVLAAGMAGSGLVVLTMVAYAIATGVGAHELWYDLFLFRWQALGVASVDDLHQRLARAGGLAVSAVLSGMVLVLLLALREIWRRRGHGSPLAWAVAVTVAAEGLSIAAGGGYWPHYLLQLAPMVALTAGVWVASIRPMRAVAVLAAISAVLALAGTAVTGSGESLAGQKVGSWVARAGRPGDTATVLYPREQLQLATGMLSPYPYLWTLPLRARDPQLAQLRALLRGPHAPTWIVLWRPIRSRHWHPHDPIKHVLATRYHLFRHVCGRPRVLLHNGVRRTAPPGPSCGRVPVGPVGGQAHRSSANRSPSRRNPSRS
ncbi:MAG: ArnT family glycosyltransferase [Nocardioidaceae bacterium]